MNKKIVYALVPACLLTLAITAHAQQAAPDPGAAVTAGKAALEASCKTCHDLAKPLGKDKTAAEWDVTVTRMIKNGAKLTGEQKGQIVAYLAAKGTFDTKCSACHGIDRPLGKTKSAADWLATAKKMAGKKPGHMTDEDVAAIAAYLAVERPAK